MRKSDYDCGQFLLDLNGNRLYTGEEKNIIKMTVINLSMSNCAISRDRELIIFYVQYCSRD